MFDSNKIFNLPNLDRTKRCQVRFPSDAEWCARAKSLKTLGLNLGRQKTRYEVPNAKDVDAKLFKQIRIDQDGPEFDQSEAAKVVERLEGARVTDLVIEAGKYRVTMLVPGAETVHVLRIPSSQRAVDEYEMQSGKTDHGPRAKELKFYLEPSGPFYDGLVAETEGYNGPVPINHKYAALRAMLTDLEAQAEDDFDPEA